MFEDVTMNVTKKCDLNSTVIFLDLEDRIQSFEARMLLAPPLGMNNQIKKK